MIKQEMNELRAKIRGLKARMVDMGYRDRQEVKEQIKIYQEKVDALEKNS